MDIGPDADPTKTAATKLFANTNMLLKQNRELKKCSIIVKNVCINSYGNVYALENMLSPSSVIHNAHRYLAMSVYSNW